MNKLIDFLSFFGYHSIMNNLIVKLLTGVVGIAISTYILKDGIAYDGTFSTILLVGLTMGLLLFFVRPILSLITLPLRLLTLNLFSFVITMFLIWLVDVIFPAEMFEISGLLNLFYTALILTGVEIIASLAFK